MIDWEKPVISDPTQDLTQFMAPTTTSWKTDYLLSEEEKELFFQTYIEGLKGEDQNVGQRVHLYTPYLYLRALTWCAYAFVEYHDPNKQIKNIDTFEKIKTFLQIDFMKKLCSPFWHSSSVTDVGKGLFFILFDIKVFPCFKDDFVEKVDIFYCSSNIDEI